MPNTLPPPADRQPYNTTRTIRLCNGPACWVSGAPRARAELEYEFGGLWQVERASCLGLCDRAPAALIDDRPFGPLLTPMALTERGSALGAASAYARPRPGETRALLALAGQTDPTSLDSAMQGGAYGGLRRVLHRAPGWFIDEVVAAKLTDRKGRPVGHALQSVTAPALDRPVVCSVAGELVLGFIDRALVDANPHLLIEGLAIAAYCLGARTAVIRLRAEHSSELRLLRSAVQQASAHGLFEHVGQRRLTIAVERFDSAASEPPLWQSEVETFASLALIARLGAEWHCKLGSEARPGAALYAVLGHVNRPGLFEAHRRLTLREMIETFGGGMRDGSAFAFALAGGDAAAFLPPAALDLTIGDPDPVTRRPIEARAVLVCDQSVSVVAMLRELLRTVAAAARASRVLGQARETVERLAAGQGWAGDVARLGELAELLQAEPHSLSQSAAVTIQSALAHFEPRFRLAEETLSSEAGRPV